MCVCVCVSVPDCFAVCACVFLCVCVLDCFALLCECVRVRVCESVCV